MTWIICSGDADFRFYGAELLREQLRRSGRFLLRILVAEINTASVIAGSSFTREHYSLRRRASSACLIHA
jgi:hypothetical protein